MNTNCHCTASDSVVASGKAVGNVVECAVNTYYHFTGSDSLVASGIAKLML